MDNVLVKCRQRIAELAVRSVGAQARQLLSSSSSSSSSPFAPPARSELDDPAEVSLTTPLQELGFDSLMVAEFKNGLSRLFGTELDTSVIYERPTLEDLAEHLDREVLPQREAPTSPRAEPEPVDPSLPLEGPLTPGQRRMWFLDRVLERRETYNVQLGVRVGVAIEPDTLRLALDHVVARHDQLRMHIVDDGHRLRQRVVPWVEVELVVRDVSSLASTEASRALTELFDEQVIKKKDGRLSIS